jgi:multidrug efflux pump subunit AcrA (membrane-fusion protein)
MAAGIIAGVAGLAGSVMQAQALNRQAEAQENIAEYNAARQEEQAAREQAAGQLRADLRRREADRTAATARAAMAQGGADTTQGSPLLLDQEIFKEGEFNANVEIANAQNEQRRLENQAKVERYEGQVRADASRSKAQASLISGIGGLFGAFG